MAETLTYDPGTDSVTTENNLNADEQDSLQVGEKMQAEQEQLLAGKYKNAEDLEKAYVELQKKLGEQGDETSETTGDTEPTDSEEDTEEKLLQFSHAYITLANPIARAKYDDELNQPGIIDKKKADLPPPHGIPGPYA